MHIAFNFHAIVPPFTGVQRAALGMLNGLLSASPELKVTVYVSAGFEVSLLPDHPGLRIKKSWFSNGNRLLRIFWEHYVLPVKLAQDGSELLHAPCYIMPFFCPKPAVVNIHDIFAFSHPDFCKLSNRAYFRRMMPRTIHKARRVIVPCKAIKNEIIEHFPPVPASKIVVVPWGVDKRFHPITDAAQRREVQKRYGLPEKFILHVGRGEPKKNILQIIEGYFAAMTVEKLPHDLVLCGPQGWGLQRLKRTITELGIESRVRQTGFVDDKDLPVLYALADALIFPSLAEGFGFPVLEAMACGTPVITSDLPAIRELAGTAVHRVPPGDLPALREAIEAVLGNEGIANQLREEGLARARNYTWQRYSESLLRIYQEVIAEEKPA
ncbi:MAG: glycosyltransferase family 4 protein [Planctomycetes bacterium]|nr:glycosyltransferase family 4 protein [Planctomycetota bacterium]